MMAVFGLGSNVEPRADYLKAAAEALAATRRSRIYTTAALLPEGAPAEWNTLYLNMAVAVETDETPQALLARVQALEVALGRVRRGHWGPREIDIDILAYGDTVLTTPTLTLPHPQLLNRDFALLPLAEVVPDWRYPVKGEHYGKTARALVEEFGYRL